MEYFIFDTETSDFGENAEVIQFAGVRLSESFKIKGLVNWYCNIDKPIAEGAISVHHLDNSKILQLSKGNYFEDYLMKPEYEWLRNPKDITFIAYNSSFDKKMINQTLKMHGYSNLNFGRPVNLAPNKNSEGVYNFCLMEGCKSVFNFNQYNKKLQEMIESQTKYSPNEISRILKELCNKFKIPNSDNGYHGALYDALATTLLFYSNRKYFIK